VKSGSNNAVFGGRFAAAVEVNQYFLKPGPYRAVKV
jgi:hypothetical protein